MNRAYDMRRRSGKTLGPRNRVYICERHLEARKVLGWQVGIELKQFRRHELTCDDCEAAKDGTVMDRLISTEDAARSAQDATVVRVLRGQRRLFE